MPLIDSLLIVGALLCGAFLLIPKVRHAKLWRAMVTPLASIIGSGFLVLAPILTYHYGELAPAAMAGLCLVAFLFGSAIRFNIAARAQTSVEQAKTTIRLEDAADWALAFAFVISVAYYLNLLGAFAVSLTPYDSQFAGRVVTSVAFLLILVTGWSGGFKALENLEYSTVTIKLAIIAGLLLALVPFVVDLKNSGNIVLSPPVETGWQAITLAFGLIITVQGFETSRYLGEEYEPNMRIRSMRLAQLVTTAIYMIYIALFTLGFPRGTFEMSETAVIDMMRIVSPLLPYMLVAAAIAAQFSAAVADTGGSGGLMVELSGGRLSSRQSYALLAVLGLGLTWLAHIFEIIAFASRAFAFYYAIQCAIAFSWARQLGTAKIHQLGFFLLIVLGAAIVLFGNSVSA